jgi:inorganic pyrophosphatase
VARSERHRRTQASAYLLREIENFFETYKTLEKGT